MPRISVAMTENTKSLLAFLIGSKISSGTITALIGIYPDERAFAIVIDEGFMENVS